MIDRKKVVNALRSCINKPRCQNCHWEECNESHETFELPKGLVMDMLDLLKDETLWKDNSLKKPDDVKDAIDRLRLTKEYIRQPNAGEAKKLQMMENIAKAINVIDWLYGIIQREINL